MMRKSFMSLASVLAFLFLAVAIAPAADSAAPDQPAATGRIAGTVTDDTEDPAVPAAGARVEAFTCADETPSGSTVAGARGEYVLPLADGCYRLRFDGEGFESSWYGDPPLKDTAQEVIVAGSEVSGIDAPISRAGAAISGRVKGEDGKPLPGAWVTAVRFDDDGGSISDGRTDDDGFFSVQVYPGSYFLIFARRGYVTRMHGKSVEEPMAVEAPAGGKAAGIEAVLAKGGRITGTLTDEAGQALQGIFVLTSAAEVEMLPVTARTDREGRFELDGLPTGKYRIAFLDREQRYHSQWHDGKTDPEEAALVEVKAPATTAGIKGVLRRAGGISGRVTDKDGNALAEVMVLARSADGKQSGGSAVTGETGEYIINGLPSGSYVLAFRVPSGPQLSRFYRDAETVRTATTVEVTAPQLTYGIDQALPDGIYLSGTVSNADGEPLAETFIAIYPAGSEKPVGLAMTEPDGTFSVPLAEGEYVVEFTARDGYLPQWTGGHADRSRAEPIVITADRAPEPLQVILSRGGAISGTVKDPVGAGIAGVRISATNTATGEEDGSASSEEGGAFLIEGLPSGTFSLTATASDAGFVRERLPQPIEVRAPATTEAIDIVMRAGGAVAGKVVDGAGNPLAEVAVAAYDPRTWDEIASSETDATGAYRIGGLPENSYRVRFEKSRFRVQWFKGKARREDSAPVEVVGTVTTAGIDAILDPGIPLTGIVTDAAGAPLFGAEVEIYGDVEDEPFDEASTDFQGRFTIPSLAAGSYRIRFSHTDHVPQWHGGRDRNTAAPVIVTETRTPTVAAALSRAAGRVSGKLTSPEGDDIGQAWLTIVEAATGVAIADERICECSGKFDTPVAAGLYQLRVERHGRVTWYGADSREKAVVLPVNGTVSGLKMTIQD